MGFFGTVQHFRGLGVQKRCTVPKKPMFLGEKIAKMLYCHKKSQKTKAWRPPGPGGEGLQNFFFVFFGFFGTVHGFFGTVQHFRGMGVQKRCTVPKKQMFLGQKLQKRSRSQTLFFFGFFGTVQHFCIFCLDWTVHLGVQKRYTVPQEQSFKPIHIIFSRSLIGSYSF